MNTININVGGVAASSYTVVDPDLQRCLLFPKLLLNSTSFYFSLKNSPQDPDVADFSNDVVLATMIDDTR
jgi:hypothetical protein